MILKTRHTCPSQIPLTLPTTKYVSLVSRYPVEDKIANFDASDGPKLWSNQPVAIQLVARPFDDERLIAVTEAVDKVVNDS